MVLVAQITETAAASLNSISVAGTETHMVNASYSGDSIYEPSLTIATVGLLADPAPSFTVGATSPVPINGSAAATANLTISTTPATRAALIDPKRPGGVSWQAAGGAGLAFIFIFCMPARRRSWQTMLGKALLMVAFIGGPLACSYGSGSGTVTGTQPRAHSP